MARATDKRPAKRGAAGAASKAKRNKVDKDQLEDGGHDEFFVEAEPRQDASGSEPEEDGEEAETAEAKRLRLGATTAVARLS